MNEATSLLDCVPYLVWAVLAVILALGVLGACLVAGWFLASVLGSWATPAKADGRFLPEVLD